MKETKKKYNDDEVYLIDLAHKLFIKKKLIFKSSLFSILIGIIYSLIQPNLYTSSSTFIPQLNSEIKSSGSSSLNGLASLAGINLGGVETSSEFPPTLYPKVIESVPFKLKLLSSHIKVNDKKLTVREYFLQENTSFDLFSTIKKYTIGLPAFIFKSSKLEEPNVSEYSIYAITNEDEVLFSKLSKSLSLSINDKEGFITMSYTGNNKNVVPQITKTAQTLLQERIIEFKIQSSTELLDYTLDQYNEKKFEFENLQDKRALFVDQNINISSSLYKNKLSRIESELNIAESIVQQLASQFEQAKLQVNKDTPVFTTIKPVTIPYSKSAPKRSSIVLGFFFLGFVLSCTYILVKKPLNKILNSIKS